MAANIDAKKQFTRFFPGKEEHELPMELRKKWLEDRSAADQFALDTAMWYATLSTPPKVMQDFFSRVFHVLNYAGLMYKAKGQPWKTWASSDMPIASAISHGGRVLIQLTDDPAQCDTFWKWLWGTGLDPKKNTRMAATHGIATLAKEELILDINRKLLQEIKPGKTNGGVELKGTHYGINFGLGGEGNINPFAGTKIDGNGEHGHFYLYYAPATEVKGKKVHGGILVGCEGSAPVDRYINAKDFFSGKLFAKDQTGHKHTFGTSGEFSPTGGKKWAADGWNGETFEKLDCMFIDLSGNRITTVPANLPKFKPEMIGTSGLPPK